MRSLVAWLLLLNGFVAVAYVAVDSDSNRNEAIQSLEATLVAALEKKFEELKAEIKENCCQGNTTGSSFLEFFLCFFFFLLLNACCCTFSLMGQSYSSCKEIFKPHKCPEW